MSLSDNSQDKDDSLVFLGIEENSWPRIDCMMVFSVLSLLEHFFKSGLSSRPIFSSWIGSSNIKLSP